MSNEETEDIWQALERILKEYPEGFSDPGPALSMIDEIQWHVERLRKLEERIKTAPKMWIRWETVDGRKFVSQWNGVDYKEQEPLERPGEHIEQVYAVPVEDEDDY